jgi:hypothetical protein
VILWVECLVEVGAGDELLAEAEVWVLANADDKEWVARGASAGAQRNHSGLRNVLILLAKS